MLNFLSQRRKAIIAFIIGLLNFALLYTNLVADGSISNGDIQSMIVAGIAWLGGTVLVHQATNAPLDTKTL